MRRLARLLLFALFVQLPLACDAGAEIVDYSPQRGSSEVATNAPVQITFDRPVDTRSVASRFHVLPAVNGQITWPRPNQLIFAHEPLKTATDYTVELSAGYKDSQGQVYSLRHWWSFHTEPAPEVVSISPGANERNFDPAGYLSVTFSRQMDLAVLNSTISLSPQTAFSLRLDPGDARRVTIAPRTLLDAARNYVLKIDSGALDIDGNRLRTPAEIAFLTGAIRPLRHWVGVAAQNPADRTGAGVFVVDENRFPRRISTASSDSFAWQEDSLGLLLHEPGDRWAYQALGSQPVELPFQAAWAASLGRGRGYVYLEQGKLSLLDGAGHPAELATNVGEAAVAPGGLRVAYTVPNAAGTDIVATDIDLRARYRLQTEAGQVSGVEWSPDGLRIAYRLLAFDPSLTEIHVRSLTGAGGTIRVAQGDMTAPRWLDEGHVVVAATVSSSAGALSRAYRLSALTPGGALTAGQGLPASGAVEVHDPWPSPDGHQIAFLGGDPGSYELWLMNADGTGLVQLTPFDAETFPYSCRALAWTPA